MTEYRIIGGREWEGKATRLKFSIKSILGKNLQTPGLTQQKYAQFSRNLYFLKVTILFNVFGTILSVNYSPKSKCVY